MAATWSAKGGHISIWINLQTGVVETIPRYTEVKEPLARKIIRNLGA